MKVKFKEHDLELHYSIRTYMILENLQNAEDPENEEEKYINSNIRLLYATLVSTLKYNKIEEKIDLDDIIEFVDNNGGINFLNAFAQWFMDCVNKESNLIPKTEDKEVVDDKKKLKKKK